MGNAEKVKIQMIPVSHAVSGFTVLYLASILAGVEVNLATASIAVGFSLLPDIDALWSDSLKSHHDSFLHYPATWLLLTPLVFSPAVSKAALLAVSATLFHLLADTLTSLTTGVKLLYPLSNREFHTGTLNRSSGGMNPSRPSKAALLDFLGLYIDRKDVLLIEAAVFASGLVSLALMLQ